MNFKVWFSNCRRSCVPNTGNHSIHLRCTLKYSIKNIKIGPVICIHTSVNVKIVFLMQHWWICTSWQYLFTGLHSTIATRPLLSSSLHGPLASNLQSKKLDFPRTWHQSRQPQRPIFLYPSSCHLHFPPKDASSLSFDHQAPCPNILLLQSPLAVFLVETESFVLYTAWARRMGMESAEALLHALLVPVPYPLQKMPAHYKLVSQSIEIRVFQNSDFRSLVILYSAFENWIFFWLLIFVFSWKTLNLFKMHFHVNNKEHKLDTSVTPAKFYVSVSNH